MLFLFALFSAIQAQYCPSGPNSVYDTTFSGVTFTGDTVNITDPTPACPGVYGVRDLTTLQADLTIGQTYRVSFIVGTCGGVYSVRNGVWIDFNRNGVYDQNESLFLYSSVYGSQSYDFTVPEWAEPGLSRARVQVQESGPSQLNPCANFTYGGTSDYSILIKAGKGPYCDSGPTQTTDMNLGPVSLAGFSSSISDLSDCPAAIGPKDLTDLVADVNYGGSYVLKYQVTDCDPQTAPWPTLSGAWIDYNQNGEYDAWELIGTSPQSGVASVSLPFTIPYATSDRDVLPGETRLRVQVQETNAEVLDPCSHFAWGGTKDFTIKILQPKNYCVSGPTTTTGTALGDVKLVGQSTTINDPATCADHQTGVVDRTGMIADVKIATPYTIEWQVIGCPTQQATMSAAWVDYNQNEILESWEQITPRSSTFGLNSFGFKVPPSSPNQVVVGGPTRLRVQVQQTALNQALDPCAAFASGGTRDFTLNILGATALNWTSV